MRTARLKFVYLACDGVVEKQHARFRLTDASGLAHCGCRGQTNTVMDTGKKTRKTHETHKRSHH